MSRPLFVTVALLLLAGCGQGCHGARGIASRIITDGAPSSAEVLLGADGHAFYGATRAGPLAPGARAGRFFLAHVLPDRVEAAPDPCAEDPEHCTFGSMTLDHHGRVVASWSTRTGDHHIHVGRLEGGRWTPLGAWPGNPVESWPLAIATGAGETLYLLSLEGPTSSAMKLVRYDGAAWTDVPAPTLPVGIASPPALATDPAGHVVLAFTSIDPATLISTLHVQRLGDGWAPLADSELGTGAARPRLAIARNGTIAVAWLAYEGGKVDIARNRHAYMRLWEHGHWRELAGSATGEGLGTEPPGSVDVALDEVGRPIVVIDQGDLAETHHDVIARRWSDVSWTGLDGRHKRTLVSAAGTFSVGPRVAVHDKRAWIAWSLHNGSEGVLAHAPF